MSSATKAKAAADGDLFRGLRLWTEPTGRQRLEGTVINAAKYTGLAPRTIRHYIESGQIESRQPGGERSDAKVKDAAGRPRAFKRLVNMKHVFKMAFGESVAREMYRQMGLIYD